MFFNFKKNELDIKEAHDKIRIREQVYEEELVKAREHFENVNKFNSDSVEKSFTQFNSESEENSHKNAREGFSGQTAKTGNSQNSENSLFDE